MNRERRRVTLALLLSLLIHVLLLSLTFGGQGLGLPGFGFPWQDRRIEVPDLRLVLVPERGAAEEPAVAPLAPPLQPAPVEQPVAHPLPPTPTVSSAPTPGRTATATVKESKPSERGSPRAGAAIGAAPAKTLPGAEASGDLAPPSAPEPPVIAAGPSDEAARQEAEHRETARVESERQEAERQAAAQQEAARQESVRQEAEQRETARAEAERREAERRDAAQQEAAQQQAAQQEAAQQEAAQQEAARREAARQEAARQEAARQEAARQEGARQEGARQESARREAARQEAAQQEAARQEAARQEAVRQEAARQEAARQEAARQEAARQEAARQEAGRQETARIDAAREAAARREAALQAIGRQLNEEAARRDAASTPERPSSSSGSRRRARLFGRADPNADLILYAETWERKIQLNMTFDMVRDAAKMPHTDPIVTVAVRSDGSVESITFVVSSGAPALDEAIRRVVHSQEHYQAFPPELAREYDVIEIRRTWRFDMAIRLY